MATDDQRLNAARGTGSRIKSMQLANFVINGAATYKAQITLPAGSYLRGIQGQTPAAITGTPTSVTAQVGTTDGGTDVMAATSVASQGKLAGALAATHDQIATYMAKATTLFVNVIVTGGTTPTGTVQVFVDYDAPVSI